MELERVREHEIDIERTLGIEERALERTNVTKVLTEKRKQEDTQGTHGGVSSCKKRLKEERERDGMQAPVRMADVIVPLITEGDVTPRAARWLSG